MAFADEPADRAAIDAVIHSLKTVEPVSQLFTTDADSDLPKLQSIEQSMNRAAHTPWSETGPPVLVINSTRFLSPDVAIVNAVETEIGPVPRKIPVLFVMKRETSGWKIAALRLLASNVV
jgi:hypothetical protein